MNLSKGANHILTRSGTVHVYLGWRAPDINVDVVCFAVTAEGRVLSDDWFLFYNQTVSPENAIEFLRSDAGRAEFILHLDHLPSEVQKCVFAAALDTASFREVTNASITATPPDGEALNFKITDVSNEQALIFAEIYCHASGWKMRAIGQGFNGGLQPLAEYYGVSVEDEPSTPPVPPVPDRPPEPIPPLPPVPPSPAGRRSGFLKKVLLATVILIAGVAGLSYFYHPIKAWLKPAPVELSPGVADSTKLPATRSSEYVESSCALTDEQVFERYHALGENYVRITRIVDVSNHKLTRFREELRGFDLDCSPIFIENNKKEIKLLEDLPVHGWMDEAVRLNICAGIMNKKVNAGLEAESRPTVIQRLLKNVDRSRNLESDLTNISRDLAYLDNKTVRLIEGYKSNLAACSM